MECGARVGGARDAVDLRTLRLYRLTAQDRHRLAIDVARCAAIIGVLQESHVGQFAAGDDRFDLYVTVVRVGGGAGVAAVDVLAFWF